MALSLFTVFHANLAFSSVPPADVPRLLERCFWPLVDATAIPGVRLGLELPVDTLELIAAEDPLLLDALRAAQAAGRLEIVGSGLVQAILPLVPAAIGQRNLSVGRARYADVFGCAPRVAYLHEQTYAAGLVPLYLDAGYEALIGEWENPASTQGWPERRRYHAAWVEGTAGSRIACLWNSSVTFQRVQRYAYGETTAEELVAYLASHHDRDEARALCLYGNDCEVFDYRPGEGGLRYGAGERGEWTRLHALFRALAADERFAFVTPGEALHRHPPVEPALRLESAAAPVPTKKQLKYNVTRWAVCGRDNPRTNARCHALARTIERAAALQRAGGGRTIAEPVLARAAEVTGRLWGSDLRTHTTDDRAAAAAAGAGALAAELRGVLGLLEQSVLGAPLAPGEVALFNPHPFPWAGWPVAVRVGLPPGLVTGGVRVTADGRELVAQAEEVEPHRDGSVRRALLVVMPVLPPLGLVRLVCRSGPAPAVAGAGAERLETGAVRVELASRRGATLRTLAFPRLRPDALAGTVPLGAFAPIELAADWYTGGVVLFDRHGTKHTDLEPVSLAALAAPGDCPVRLPVAVRLAGPWGELWKTIFVYRDVPRVDLRYHFVLRDERPRSLRLGVLTLTPDAFAPGRLRYATVNGGRDVERFALGHVRVAQHDAVSPTVSARGCLGATEGWVDVGDDAAGVTMVWDPATLAAAPLVQHEPAGDRALTRVHLSLAESDDTAAPFFRGHTTFTVSYLGRGEGVEDMRRQAVAAASGLHVIGGEAA